MLSGLETAFGEITLVLFTTMAPAGTFALMIMGAISLRGGMPEHLRAMLDRFTCIPLVVALVGLIASATHLGNPANALYVLAGVGRSPLSNEVISGVVFLGMAGVYWLTSFSERPNVALRRAALILVEVAGALFVTAIAFAYDAKTIVTWHTPYVPASLWVNALVAGPPIALLALFAAGYPLARRKAWAKLLALSGVACAVNVVVYVLQGIDLKTMENHMTTAVQQAPGFPSSIPLFVALVVAGVVLAAFVMRRYARSGEEDFSDSAEPRALFGKRDERVAVVLKLVGSCVLVLAGVFVMRFGFYTMHMTVGLGV